MSADIRKIIGGRIKEVRKALNLTQKEFGDVFSINRERMGRIELGDALASPLILNKMYEKFNVCSQWIINGTGKMFVDNKMELKDLYPGIRNIEEYEQLMNLASNLGMDKIYMAVIKEWESKYGVKMLESFGLVPISRMLPEQNEEIKSV